MLTTSSINTSTSTGALTLITDTFDFSSSANFSINAAGQTVNLRQLTNGTALNLGTNATTTWGLGDAQLDRITAGTLQIGDANSGAITVSAVISPLSYQTLNLGKAASFSATGGLALDVTSATVYERVQVQGAVSIDPSATLAVNSSYNAAVSDLFTLVENTSGGTTTGTFAGKPQGATVLVGTTAKKITYVGGTGANDVVLVGFPEINVTGNAVTIADDDTTPATADHTHFGNVPIDGASRTRIYTIQNTGGSALTISSITKSGTDAADFTISGAPASVAAGASATFNVTFNPTTAGTKTATITIASDDSDEASYDFAIEGTALAAGLALTFVEQTGAANPLNAITGYNWTRGGFVDVDNDGDQDAFIGTSLDSSIHFWRNDGTASAAVFTDVTGSGNPFNGVGFNRPDPVFVDLDNDGDKDAIVGVQDGGRIRYFQNTGTNSSPAFTELTGGANPLNLVTGTFYHSPDAVDIDADGDFDVIDGGVNGDYRFFRNDGNANTPSFVAVIGAANPLNEYDIGFNSSASFADADGDGDKDLISGEFGIYYRNTGTASAGEFIPVGSPGFSVTGGIPQHSAPVWVDIDADGDFDFFNPSAGSGTVQFFLNTTPPPSTLTATLVGENLTIEDTVGEANTLTVMISGLNLVITDANESFASAPAGGTLSNGGKTLTIPFSLVDGGILELCGGADDDQLTIDLSGGNVIPAGGLLFDGQTNGVGGDELIVTGGTTTSVTHIFTNANDGSITLAGALVGTITYTGLEPITDNLSATDRVFTFNGGAETITLTDATGANMTIDSTLSESVTFANPTGSLTINAGTLDDMVTVTSFDAAYRGAVSINGDAGTDTVNWNAVATLGSASATGDVSVVADVIAVTNSIAADTGEMISVSLTSTGDVSLSGANADVTTGGGTFTVDADFDDNGSGGFILDLGSSVDVGAGNISITATDVALNGPLAGTGTLALLPSQSGRDILIGAPSFISVNFADAAASNRIEASETAGYVPFQNWNNLSIGTTNSGIVSSDGGGTSLNVTLSGSAFTNGSAVTSPNQKLLNFQVYSGNPEISLTNIPIAAYDLYVYAMDLHSGSPQQTSATVVAGSFNTTYYYGIHVVPFSTTGFVVTTDTVNDPNDPFANVIHASGLSSSSLTVNSVDGLVGFQLVSLIETFSTTAFTLTDAELSKLADGFASITIGDAVSGTGAVDIDSSTFSDPVTIVGGSIAVEGLNAGANAVTLTARAGAITDGGGTTDVTASSLAASATTGIGSGNALETIVSMLSFANTTNAVEVTNTLAGGLTVSGTNAGTGTVSITETTGNLTVGAADIVTNSGAVNLTASALNKSLNSASGSDVVTNNSGVGAAVTWAADNSDLGGNITAGTGVVTLKQSTTGTTIDVGSTGGPTNGKLELSDAELDRITAGTLQIGDANSGAITVSAAISHGNHLSLTTGAGITFNQAVTMAVDKNFTASALGTSNGTISFANANADLATTGTGAVSLTTVRNILLASGSSVTTVDGALTLNANVAATGTGSFNGIGINGSLTSSGAGPINLTGRGGNTGGTQNGIFLNTAGIVTSSGTGAINITGFGGGGAGSDNNDASEISGLLTSVAGAVTITGTAGVQGGISTGISMAFGTINTSAGTASVILIGDTFYIGDGGFSQLATINAGTNQVTLRQLTNAIALNLGTEAYTTWGVDDASLDRITAGTLQIGDANSGAITVSSAISAPAGWNTLSLQTGANIVDGNSTGNDLTVTNLALRAVTGIGSAPATLDTAVSNLAAANTTSGNLDIRNTGGLTITSTAIDGLTGVTNADANSSIRLVAASPLTVNAPVSSAGGVILSAEGNDELLTIAATVSGGADSVFIADKMAISATVNVGTKILTLLPESTADANDAINLGSAVETTANTLELSDVELDLITAGTVQIGDASSGTITVSAAITHANNLSLTTGRGVTFNDAVTMAVNKNFTASALGTSNGTIYFANANADLATTGTGAVSLTTVRDILMELNSSVTTVNGGITMAANTALTGTGLSDGISVMGLVQSTGSGNVSLTGKTTANAHGVVATGAGSSVQGGTSGTLTIDGTSTGSGGIGVRNFTGGAIGSAGAHVSITGVGDAGSGQGIGIQTAVTVVGAGDLTLNGTGGFQGLRLLAGLSTVNGNISLTGTNNAVGTTDNRYAIHLTSSATTTTGTITLTGTGGGSGGSNHGVSLLGATINSGSTVDITGTAGSGASSLGLLQDTTSTITATTTAMVNANSRFASISTTDVTATTLDFTSGNDLNVSITNAVTYDTLSVVGQVDITGVDLVLLGSFVPASSDSFTLILNDGTDAVIGTFTGLAEGAIVSVNGVNKKITYGGGSGNDVVLRPANTLTATIVGNDLVIEDVDGTGKNNLLSVSRSGANLVISDTNEQFGTAIAGAVLSNGEKTVTIPATALGTGGKIIFKTLAGSDSLSVDVSTDLGFDVEFQGGTGTSDSLTLAADTVTSVTHAFTNANDGSVTIVDGGSRVITYTGLEPITDNLSATDRVFNLPAGVSNTTLADDLGGSGNGLSRLSSVNNGTGLFSIDAGTDSLHRIDPATGAATLVGLLGVNLSSTAGAAADPITGTIYMTSDGAGASLFTVNPNTGVATVVGPLGVNIPGLAIDTDTGVLYGISGLTDSLYTINTTTGAATLVGAMGVDVSRNGAAYDTVSNTLYMESGTSLYTVNTTTGAASLVGANGVSGIHGIEFDALDGILYGVSGTTDQLYSINTATGTATSIGTLGVNFASGVGLGILNTGIAPTTFANPTGSLTINRGNVSDVTTVGALPDFNAGLTVGTAANPFSALTLSGAVTLAAGNNLSVSAFSLTATTTGAIAVSGGGSITANANDVNIDVASTLNAGTGTATFVQVTANRPINLGTNTAGSLSLTDAELDRITAGTLRIGDANSGAITVSAAMTQGKDLSLTTGAGITVDQAVTATDRNVYLNSDSTTLNAALDVGTGTVSTAGDVTNTTTTTVAASSTFAVGAFPLSGLVSLWHAEGDAVDAFDGNSGTLNNGATTATGQIGQAFSFDGVDDYVRSPLTITSNTPTTVSAWINPASFLSSTLIKIGDKRSLFIVPDNGGSIYFGGTQSSMNSANQGVYAVAPGLGGLVNQWIHVAGTWDGTTSRIYINGTLIDTNAVGNGNESGAFADTTIGYGIDAPGYGYFSGRIDEAAVYDRALSLAEIQALRTGGTYTQTAGMTIVNGTLSAGTVDLQGGTLKGTGTVTGAVTAASGGTVAPGTSPGTLNTGNLTLVSGSIFQVEAESTANSDKLAVTGTVSLGNATLSLVNFGTPVVNDGDRFLIINNDGTSDAVSGTFNGYSAGAIVSTDFLGSGKTARIIYNGGDGNDVAIVVDSPAGSPVTINDPDPGNPTSFEVRVVGGNVQTLADGVIIDNRPLAGVAEIEINGEVGQNDTLTVNLTTNLDLANLDSITFNAGGDASDDIDVTSAMGGSDYVVTYDDADPDAGIIDIDNGALQLIFDGVGDNTITFGGTVNELTINFGNTADNIVFTAIDGTNTQVAGDNFATTSFANPATSLTITLGDNGETVTFTDLANSFNPSSGVTINGGAGADTIIISNLGDAFGDNTTGALTINGAGDADILTFQTTTPSLASLSATAETINVNVASVTTIGIQSYTGNIEIGTNAELDGSAVNVTGNVNGAFNLTLDGVTDVSGTIGTTIVNLSVETGNLLVGTIDITGNLTSDAGLNVETDVGAINVDGDLTTGGTLISETGVDVGGDSSLGGNVTSQAGSLVLGNATSDDVMLTASVLLTATALVDISGGVSGAFNLDFAGATGNDVEETIGTNVVNVDVSAGNLTAGTIDITGNLTSDAGLNIETDVGVVNVDGDLTTGGTLISETGVDVGGDSSLGGSVTSQAGSIVLGNATSDDVTLTATVLLTASAMVDISGGVSGAFSLDFAGATGNDVEETIGTNVVNVDVSAGNLTAGTIDITGNLTSDAGLNVETDVGVVNVDGDLTTGGTLISETGVDVGGDSSLGGNVTSQAGSIVLGNATSDDVTLTATVLLTASAMVDISGGVSGAFNLDFAGATGNDVEETIGTNVVNVDVSAGNLTAGTIDITGNLTSDAGLNVETDVGVVNVDGDLTTGGTLISETGVDVGGDSSLGGNVTSQNGGVSLTSGVTLTANVSIDSSAGDGNILFGSTVASGGNNLTLNAGDGGNVTVTGALSGGGDMTVVDGDVQSYAALTVNSLDIQDATVSVTFSGATIVTTSVSVVSGGTIEVDAKMTVGTTVVFDAADNITIDADIDPTTVTMTSDDDILVNADVVADDLISLSAGQDNTGGVTISVTGSLTTTDPGSDVSISTGVTSGNVVLTGTITAVDQATITSSAGNISGVGLVTAGPVVLSATAGTIGTSAANPVRLSATSLTTNTSGGGNQFLREADTVNIGANDLNAGAGTITLVTSGTFLTTLTGSILSPLIVGNGATVGGTGITGTITTQSGGTIAPGNSPGILNSGNVTMVGGSNFSVELDGIAGAGAVGGHDQLNVTGTVSLGGANLVVSLGYAPADGDSYVIINNDSTDAVIGTFMVGGMSIPDGGCFHVGNTIFIIDYTSGSDSNDVTLTAKHFVKNVPSTIFSLAGNTTLTIFVCEPTCIVAVDLNDVLIANGVAFPGIDLTHVEKIVVDCSTAMTGVLLDMTGLSGSNVGAAINDPGNVNYNPNFNLTIEVLCSNNGDTVRGSDFNELIHGGNGADEIDAHDGFDIIYGGGDNDTIDAGEGTDYIDGGVGDDILHGGPDVEIDPANPTADHDTIYGGAGNDEITGGLGNDYIVGLEGDDTISGNDGNDTIYGSSGADEVYGETGDDQVSGGIDNDIVSGGTGVDIATGELGDDQMVWDAEDVNQSETLDGGVGADILVANGTNDADEMTIGQVSVNNFFVSSTYASGNITRIVASSTTENIAVNGLGGDDTIRIPARLMGTGTARTLTITGGEGDDTIDGTGASLTGFVTIAGPPAYFTSISGNEGDDSITGTGSSDFISGGDGEDILAGMAGNDSIDGDSGSDTISGGAGNDLVNNAITTSTSEGDDEIDGGTGNDSILGGGGIDTILGDAGNDTLLGGDENDDIQGGTGNDSIDGQDGDDVLVGDAGNDTFVSTVITTSDNDDYSGGDGNDTMLDDSGSNTVLGGTGNDTLTFVSVTGLGQDINGEAGNDNISTGNGDDTLTGGIGNDTLKGGPADDALDGGDGNDSLDGQAGNDNLVGGIGNDKLDESLLGGDDTLSGGTGNDSIKGGAGEDSIQGNAGNDKIDGGADHDTIFGDTNNLVAPETGNDSIKGGSGDDTIDAGAGNDQVTGDTDIPADINGIMAGIDDVLSGRDNILGGDGNDSLEGGAGNDIIQGGDGNDKISGDDGDDIITGGLIGSLLQLGRDTLAGNAGIDALDNPTGLDKIDEKLRSLFTMSLF